LKAAVGQVRQEYAFSQRRACRLMTVAVSSYRYQTKRNDEGLRLRLVELAREKPRFGYRRLHVLPRRKRRETPESMTKNTYVYVGMLGVVMNRGDPFELRTQVMFQQVHRLASLLMEVKRSPNWGDTMTLKRRSSPAPCQL
jgi:hypothetical protein